MRIRTTIIALATGLALVGTGLAAATPALAGSVTIESHRSGGTRSWSGGPPQARPRDDRGWDHGRRDDRGWDRGSGHRGHHGYGHGHSGHGHHRHGWHGGRPHYHHGNHGWTSAPSWVPPRWEWNGWGWVYVPGYWY